MYGLQQYTTFSSSISSGILKHLLLGKELSLVATSGWRFHGAFHIVKSLFSGGTAGRERGRWPRKAQQTGAELPPRPRQCRLLLLTGLDTAVGAVEGGRSYQCSNSTVVWLGTQTAPGSAFRRDKEGYGTLDTPLSPPINLVWLL